MIKLKVGVINAWREGGAVEIEGVGAGFLGAFCQDFNLSAKDVVDCEANLHGFG